MTNESVTINNADFMASLLITLMVIFEIRNFKGFDINEVEDCKDQPFNSFFIIVKRAKASTYKIAMHQD